MPATGSCFIFSPNLSSGREWNLKVFCKQLTDSWSGRFCSEKDDILLSPTKRAAVVFFANLDLKLLPELSKMQHKRTNSVEMLFCPLYTKTDENLDQQKIRQCLFREAMAGRNLVLGLAVALLATTSSTNQDEESAMVSFHLKFEKSVLIYI